MIIQYLETKTEPVKTLDIAKALFNEQATARHVNPFLYSLKAKGFVKKFDTNGKDVKWSIGSAALTPKYRDAVLAYLRGKDATPTKDIKVAILGPGGKSQEINKILYDIQNEGLVTRIADNANKNPKWQLRG